MIPPIIIPQIEHIPAILIPPSPNETTPDKQPVWIWPNGDFGD